MRGTFKGDDRAPVAWAPIALWGIGMAVGAYSTGIPAVGAGLAVMLAAGVLLRRDPIAAALTVVSVSPATAALSLEPWAWIATAVFAAYACIRTTGDEIVGHAALSAGALQRHMAWCRRREEPAHLLVAHFGAPAEHVLGAFRLTDSVSLGRRGTRAELHALVDDKDFNRRALEQRLRREDPTVTFGWAEFPRDGVALDVLLEHARAELDRQVHRSRERPHTTTTSAVALASSAGRS